MMEALIFMCADFTELVCCRNNTWIFGWCRV